jgi:hypothetical protein
VLNFLLIYFVFCGRLQTNGLEWSDLKNLLMSEGESIDPDKLQECLSTLVGGDVDAAIGDNINSLSFASRILGFEDLMGEQD